MRKLCVLISFIIILFTQPFAQATVPQKPFFTTQQEEYLSANPSVFAYFSQMYEGKTPEQVAKKYGISDSSNRKYLKALADIGVIDSSTLDHASSPARFLVTGVFSFSPGGPLSNKLSELMLKEHYEKTLTDLKNRDSNVSFAGLWINEKDYKQYLKDLKALEDKYVKLSIKNRTTKKQDAFRVSSFIGLIPKWEPKIFHEVKND